MEILRIVLTIIFVIAAIAIIAVVLMQEGKSAGLGSLSGSTGNNDTYWDKNKKHSLEGKFERWTKITAGLFVVVALALMVLPKNTPNVTIENPTTTEAPVATEAPATDGAETAPEATEAPAQ